MLALTLHAETNRTGPDLIERVPWLMFVFTHQLTTEFVVQ
jgi:hypothetical protein